MKAQISDRKMMLKSNKKPSKKKRKRNLHKAKPRSMNFIFTMSMIVLTIVALMSQIWKLVITNLRLSKSIAKQNRKKKANNYQTNTLFWLQKI